MIGENDSNKTLFIKNTLKKLHTSIVRDFEKLNKTINIYNQFNQPIDNSFLNKPSSKTITYETYQLTNPIQNITYRFIDSAGYDPQITNKIWINDIVHYLKKNVYKHLSYFINLSTHLFNLISLKTTLIVIIFLMLMKTKNITILEFIYAYTL